MPTLTIKSYEIASWPRALLCNRDFDEANLCRVKTWQGYELEILFDRFGFPLMDRDLIDRIGNFYRKKFFAIMIDGEPAYAHLIRPINSRTRPDFTRRSNPNISHKLQ
jgi:hypothetical protein